ncbi:hypothetical protein MPRG_23770 [Mycobacterium paragordonae]|uniref:Transposase n=1 Tax=Mycobacterium paragordonae TaxID=1389713 RepID=A0ABQ1C3U2_9MYCO|nr:hypothetical protein MPRG_23770 [Mycobacterium paragordonae]
MATQILEVLIVVYQERSATDPERSSICSYLRPWNSEMCLAAEGTEARPQREAINDRIATLNLPSPTKGQIKDAASDGRRVK